MKRIFLIFALIVSALIVMGQDLTTVTQNVYGSQVKDAINANDVALKAAIVAGVGGITASDTAAMLSTYINKADTAAMLTTYINKADTAAMLNTYINKADTAAMLATYINVEDTASMLTNYITAGETADGYQPLEATLTDIADGTITENLVNTTNPWADNEVASSGTWNTMLQDSLGWQIVDAATYGDGVVDATAHIQAKYDAVSDSGGVVFYPNGTYRITDKIEIRKPTHSLGSDRVKRYTTSGGTRIDAGCVLVADMDGSCMFDVRHSNGSSILWTGTTFENLQFLDLNGNNDTLLHIYRVHRADVNNCTFQGGEIGLIINGDGEDASWAEIIGNHFTNNDTCLYLKGFLTTNNVRGGSYSIYENQVAVYGYRCNFSNISGFKIDINETDGQGVVLQKVHHVSVNGVIIEIATGNDNTIGFNIKNSGGVTMYGCATQGNSANGISFKIDQGENYNDPSQGNVISGGYITGGNYGVYLEDTTQGTIIENLRFFNTNTSDILIESGSHYNVISNCQSNKTYANGVDDSGSNTRLNNWMYLAGGARSGLDGQYNFAADGQTDDDYEISLPHITALYAGLRVTFTATTANTDGATLEITSIGDLDAILKNHDQALVTGDIEAGQVVECVFDGTNWQMISQLAQ